jgi:hypothetical protein
MNERTWWPLREALAWVVSRDDEFTRKMDEKTFTGDFRPCNLEASNLFLCLSLEKDMLQAGCFTKRTRMLVRGGKRVKIEEYSLTKNYRGRFQRLAENYETARQESWRVPSLHNFLVRRLCDAAKEIAKRVADEKLRMRDVDGNVPPERAETLAIVSQPDELFPDEMLLPDGEMVDANGDLHRNVTVNREELLRQFPRERLSDPESLCRWLEGEMRKSTHRRPKPREDFKIEALKMFPGLSARAFDRAWKAAIKASAAEWSRPGRPRKKSSH